MKLHTLKERVSVIRGDQAEASQFGIEGKNMHLAIQAFYQYSDPIGSIIREITSNAYDAHIEADVNKPVIVRMKTDENTLEILDFGVGLSPDRIRDVFTKFFSSTKRDSNTQIGAFGLGAKSPLSYTDTFQVITKYGNTIYEYAVLKNDGVPDMVKVDENTFDPEQDQWDLHINSNFPWQQDENGTLICIPYQSSNQNEIKNSIKKQLCYFDNVVVDIPGEDWKTYNSEKIHRGNYIIYRETETRNYGIGSLHICMGKVYYPLNFTLSDFFEDKEIEEVIEQALEEYVKETNNVPSSVILKRLDRNSMSGSPEYRGMLKSLSTAPLALYFTIGELPILWHRENIEYTDKAKKDILKKAIKAILELDYLQRKKMGTLDTLEQGIKAVVAGTDESQVYMNKYAREATGYRIAITELENLITRSTRSVKSYRFLRLPEPSDFINRFLEEIDDKIAYKGLPTLKGFVKADKENRAAYRIEPGEKRKPKLKAYMKAKNMPAVVTYVSLQKFLSSLKENSHPPLTLTPNEEQLIKKYYDQARELFNNLTPANDIDIPESFYVAKTGTVSQLPILWRALDGIRDSDVTYNRSDYLNPNSGPIYGRSIKPTSTLIYGYQQDRSLLNAFIGYGHVGSIFRKPFTGKTGTYSADPKRAIVGIIAPDNVEVFAERIPTVIHIHDFLSHRRGISNLATRELIILYRKKYPWFNHMLLKYDRSKWHHLAQKELISRAEKDLIDQMIPLPYTESIPELAPYINKAIKNRLFHYDELDAVRWLHGMYAKYAFALTNAELIEINNHLAQEHYFHIMASHIPFNINPILYRKYHVKHIENEA